MDINSLISAAPDNFVIQNALAKCAEVVDSHNKILCSISGGSDSDVMLDMMLRCGSRGKTDFVFFDTGLEYKATLEHLDNLEGKYGVHIERCKPVKPIPVCVKEYGIPFWSKYASELISRLQTHDFQWEDSDYNTLVDKYPKCKSAIRWFCNESSGSTTQFIINRAPYMREYMINYPPGLKYRINVACMQRRR